MIGTAAALEEAGRHADVLGPIVTRRRRPTGARVWRRCPGRPPTWPSATAKDRYGFDMLSLANNHALDLGEAGLLREIEEAKARGFSLAAPDATLRGGYQGRRHDGQGAARRITFDSCVRQRTSSVQMSPPVSRPGREGRHRPHRRNACDGPWVADTDDAAAGRRHAHDDRSRASRPGRCRSPPDLVPPALGRRRPAGGQRATAHPGSAPHHHPGATRPARRSGR